MKNAALVIVVTMLLITLCACGAAKQPAVPEPAPDTVPLVSEETVAHEIPEETPNSDIPEPALPAADFSTLLADFSVQHKAIIESEDALDSILQYLVEDPETVNLLSKEEIQELMKNGPSPLSVTYEEAVHDVDVLFRAFRSAYGAYYYFGENTFQNAQAQILEWLDGRKVVFTTELSQIISKSLSFLQDAHSRVGDRVYEKDLRHEYFYTDLLFAQDSEGYYLYSGGEKWYVDSFSDSKVTIAPTLTADGELLYSPVLFCTVDDMKASTVILKNASTQTKDLPINWTLSQAYGPSYRTPDFKLLEENGIAYVSVRCFDDMYERGELSQFVASGKEVRDANLIIFDIRANGGGNDRFADNWIQNYSGTAPQYNRFHTTRISPLRNAYLARDGMPAERGTVGTFRHFSTQGKQISNEIPIIVLVDDTCGSSGESMLNDLRCLDNVMTVGSNSAGYQMCGNIMNMWLPHSKIPLTFGVSFMFNLTVENVDFKGYEPDVWCNPANALDSVLNMLLRYELTDEATWQSLKANPMLQRPVNLILNWLDFEVHPDEVFGSLQDSGQNIISVSVDGEIITDFTATSHAPELLEASVTAYGNLCLSRLQSFDGTPIDFTITYQDKDFVFHCVDSTWSPN